MTMTKEQILKLCDVCALELSESELSQMLIEVKSLQEFLQEIPRFDGTSAFEIDEKPYSSLGAPPHLQDSVSSLVECPRVIPDKQ